MLYIAIVRYQSIAVGVYLVLQILWIVSVDQSLSYLGAAFALSVIGLANLALGFATCRWFAAALPFLTVIIAVPLGYPTGIYHEPLPVWFGVLLLAPVAAALVVLGVAARKIWNWQRSGQVT
jgi:hypothetical protein